ncbi:MAG: alpha/beta fold hydrolase [Phenylobacterium sp.]
MRTIVKIVAGIVVAVVVLAGLAAGYRAIRVGQRAQEMTLRGPNAVQEAMFVRVGGIGQWVSIRGEDRANPVLLIVHGGPGGSMLPNQYLFRGWEKDFTLVQWDQRGAGKTFSRIGPEATGELSIDGIAADGVAVADWVRRRLGKPKIILLGHSWGTVVASEMARRRPDLFSAYVATGQVVNMQRGEALAYRLLTARVKAAGDAKALAKLEAIGPPPYRDMAALSPERQVLFAHPPASERGRRAEVNSAGMLEPQLGLMDVPAYAAAQRYSNEKLYRALMGYDAYARGVRFQTPVFIFQGSDDIQTPTALAVEYFGKVQAPHKELVLLPGGGHFAIISLRDQFLAELRSRVKPLATAAGSTSEPAGRPGRLP